MSLIYGFNLFYNSNKQYRLYESRVFQTFCEMAYSLGEQELRLPHPVHGFSKIGNVPTNFPTRVAYGILELVVSPRNQMALKKTFNCGNILERGSFEQTYLKHQATSLSLAS